MPHGKVLPHVENGFFSNPHSKDGVSMRPAALPVALFVVFSTVAARSAEMSIGKPLA